MVNDILQHGLAALALELPAQTDTKLLAFLGLLDKWNQTYNLTAVREPAQMVTRHVLDSLVLVPYLKGTRVLDIGTGAGLPGIPLALAQPQRNFVLLDSNAKKTRFVTQVVAELGIKNVSVVHQRVEQYPASEKFDTLVSRAFSAIADMLAVSGHLCAPGGQFLAMKGTYPREELTQLPAGFKVESVETLHVPGLEATRHLAIIVPNS